MAIKSFELVGNWKANAPKRGFNDTDIKLLTSDKAVEKIRKIFSNSRYNFRLVFARVPNGRRYVMKGAVNSFFLKNNLGLDIEPDDDCITVVCTNNTAADRITLTGWMIAHRIGHVMAASYNGFNRNGFFHSFETFNNSVRNHLVRFYGMNPDDGFYGNARYARGLFEEIGTMRSARRRMLRRPYEFGFELVAQHILQGRIRLNDFPERVRIKNRKAWGRDNSVYSRPINLNAENHMDNVVGQYESNIECSLMENEGGILLM